MIERCAIIGVLDSGAASLSTPALERLRRAQMVIGNRRTLDLFADELAPDADLRDLTGNISRTPEWIREAQQDNLRCVVLATGDPLCHGIAAYLLSRLCVDAFDILPNVSTIQLACARLSLPWQELKICSIHSRDAGEWQPEAGPDHGLYPLRHALAEHDRIAVLTSPDNSPNRVARMLLSAELDQHFQMAVVEHLEMPSERVVSGLPIATLAERRFADPNVVLLWRQQARRKPVLLGHADHSFQQRSPEKGLITKREVRAVSLARLQLRADSVVWDIGAGSGSLGLEAAQLSREGYVYAIEKNPADLANCRANQRALGLHNYRVELGKAPDGLDSWPDPDAVFVGGSGGELAALITLIIQRLKPGGCCVLNFVTVENLSCAVETLKSLDVSWDITQLQASRSKPILAMQRLAAENPVWVVCAEKPTPDSESLEGRT